MQVSIILYSTVIINQPSMLMNLCQTEKARYYERVIQKLQNELGLQISSFPDLNIYPVEDIQKVRILLHTIM
jgi:hypothetical protein